MTDSLSKRLGLYVIVDGKIRLSLVRQLLDAGVRSIQLRDKEMPPEKQLPIARDLQQACRAKGALFFVNDHVDVALDIGADGVHIGQQDLPLEKARAVLGPEALIGVSVSTVAEAEAAVAGGANYIGVGPIYKTYTKPGRKPLGPEVITRIRAAVSIPQVAIAGIGPGRARAAIEAGATGVAVISAIFDAPHPVQAAAALLEEVQSAKRNTTDLQTN